MKGAKTLPRFPKQYSVIKETHPCPFCGWAGIHTNTHVSLNCIVVWDFVCPNENCDEGDLGWAETISH